MSDETISNHPQLEAVQERIGVAARHAGRNGKGINLIAVSKTFFADDIIPVIEAGQRCFGENRVQESQSKWPELRERYADIDLHLIGPLQSNKAKEAVALFDAIHTIDREKIARAIAKEMKAQNRSLKLFIQINTGLEPQKAGIAATDLPEFLKLCREEIGLTIEGLMCIPPVDEPPSPHFALLKKLADENGLKGLSMGMSGDFEAAVASGATHVRVGSLIFGNRG